MYCSFALSATFDKIDSDLLLHRLTEWFGIDGVVLQWVRSYLTGRSQLVKIKWCTVYSAIVIVRCSASLCVGSTSLSSVLTACGLKHHLYADDTQIYTSFVAEDITQSLFNCCTKLYAGNLGLDEPKHAET